MKRIACLIICITLIITCVLPAEAYDAREALRTYNGDPLKNAQYSSYAVVNTKTDKILEGKNANKKLAVGSLVKLMTLLVVFEEIGTEKINLGTKIKVPKGANKLGGNKVFLNPEDGEKVTVEQCLNAICVNSASDAAYTLAVTIGGTEKGFVDKMNAKAKEMGLKNTSFADSTGLIASSKQYSTAEDLVKIATALVKNYPQITNYTSQKKYAFKHSTSRKDTNISNNNVLLSFYPKATGLAATSMESSGYCVAGSASINNEDLVVVVLGAKNDNQGIALARKLMENCARNYEYVTVDVKGSYVRKVAVKNGKEKTVKAEIKEDFRAFVKKEDIEKIEKEIVPNETIEAPIEKGDVVGKIQYTVGMDNLGSVDIVAAENVKKANIFVRLWRWFISLFGLE